MNKLISNNLFIISSSSFLHCENYMNNDIVYMYTLYSITACLNKKREKKLI